LSLRTRDFVAAARLSGAGGFRIARRDPARPGRPVITYAAIQLPSNVITEAALSFLGVGVRPPTSSWGQMLSTATHVVPQRLDVRADPRVHGVPHRVVVHVMGEESGWRSIRAPPG